jgi:Holliday junction resolvase RusA-like endonuclease
MAKKKKRLKSIKPEILYLKGNVQVPSKTLTYKEDSHGEKVVAEKASTHQFENDLRKDIKGELENIKLFPTEKPVFVSITHGLNSKKRYNSYDLDNKAKTILDALKGVVYKDDSQVEYLWTDKELLADHSENYLRIAVKILNSKLSMQMRNKITAITGIQ